MDQSTIVSLVICTRNRSGFLGPFFDSLRLIQSAINWEVIFVDNGSTDDTFSQLTAFAQSFGRPVKIVTERQPGLGRARNAGWPQAAGPIVAFTDDDCYPAPDFIDCIASHFLSSDIGYFGGRVELFDPTDLPITIKTETIPEFFPAQGFVGPGYLHGANLAFRKNTLKQIGGFDSLMGSGTPFPAEDCDAVFRASMSGFKGAYFPDVLVHHHHRRRSAADKVKIEGSYMHGRGAFYAKALSFYPRKLRTLLFWYKSANFFGWSLLGQEISTGMHYLKRCKRLDE
jgi:glycosyltransferase involved in cell wall biosynthesis